ncbi:hypothetical protein GVAV_000986 [Gurleya vavrai]
MKSIFVILSTIYIINCESLKKSNLVVNFSSVPSSCPSTNTESSNFSSCSDPILRTRPVLRTRTVVETKPIITEEVVFDPKIGCNTDAIVALNKIRTSCMESSAKAMHQLRQANELANLQSIQALKEITETNRIAHKRLIGINKLLASLRPQFITKSSCPGLNLPSATRVYLENEPIQKEKVQVCSGPMNNAEVEIINYGGPAPVGDKISLASLPNLGSLKESAAEAAAERQTIESLDPAVEEKIEV